MKPQLRAALENCHKPAEVASSLPPVFYTSESHIKPEIETIFRGSWIGIGRADVVRAPGDFITMDIAGQNIIVLRDKTGNLRAHANTCRHRGARLVDGSGTCAGLRCPFHSWSYALDGKLVAAPHMNMAEGFCGSDYGLVSHHIKERLGFAFLCLASDPPDLDAYLGDFADLHEPWPLKDLVTIRRQTREVDCNWKLFLEVFNEYYHLPFVHADSIDSLYAKPDAANTVTGAYASQFGTTDGTGGLLESDQDKSLPDIPGLTGQAKTGARYTWLFPNLTFAANSDALWCYEAYPISANKCFVVQSSCFPQETIDLPDFDEKSQAYLKRMDAALEEDILALVNQQIGMNCPDALQGRFQPELEPNVASFARWYAEIWHKGL